MSIEQIIYLLTILLDLLIIGIIIWVICAIVKAIRKHFVMLSEIKQKLADLLEKVDKDSTK